MELRRVETEEARLYETPIGLLPSVTSILRVLSKPALIGWAAKVTGESMRRTLEDIRDRKIPLKSLTDAGIERLVKEAKGAHREETKRALDVGSLAHEWIEEHEKGNDLVVSPEIQAPVEAYLAWEAANDVRPIAVEERIWSSERFAGTLDLYAEVKGVRTLIDFKSSAAHYPKEHAMQLGAYSMAASERWQTDIEGFMIVRLDKKTGIPDPKSYSWEEVYSGYGRFRHLLAYWWLTEGESLKIST